MMSSRDGRLYGVLQRVRPAYRQVADQLRTLILDGVITPGERLPSEAELSELFGVSRSTLREALRELSSLHFVLTSRGKAGGTYVRQPDPSRFADLLETGLGLLASSQAVGVDELLEARELLEVPASRLAAIRLTSVQLEGLRATLPADAEDVNRAHLFEGNFQFHALLLHASGNKLLELMGRPVFGVLRGRFLRDAAPSKFWANVASDHRRIFAAIEAKDADRAATEMEEHLRRLRSTYLSIDRSGTLSRHRIGRGRVVKKVGGAGGSKRIS